MQGTINYQQKVLKVTSKLYRPRRVATPSLKISCHFGDLNGSDLDRALQFQLKQASKTQDMIKNSQKVQFEEQYDEIKEEMKEWIDNYQKTHAVPEESDDVQHDLKDRAQQLISETEKAGIQKQLSQQNSSVPKNGNNNSSKNGVNKGPVFLKDGSILYTSETFEAQHH
eukprot:TRINITY_DN1545_c1_g1_i1.p1 TRINITY_DN1545_c1_g1~~TRINITY_DN1545_c1_g1_i1.p1  ORF type:complete len:169 (-),score=21.24 TRINITY_DN1545_c1_g1_i1:327-833(-)